MAPRGNGARKGPGGTPTDSNFLGPRHRVTVAHGQKEKGQGLSPYPSTTPQLRYNFTALLHGARLRNLPVRSQQHRFQFQKRAQELIRLDNVAFAIAFVGVNNSTPASTSHGAAIAPRPAGNTELVSDDFPVFHGITSIFITG